MQFENANLQTFIVNSGVRLQWATETFYHLKSCPITPTGFIELNSYWLSTVSLLYNSLLLSSFFTFQTQKLPMQIFLETRISSLMFNESLFKLFFSFIITKYCEIFQWTECVSILFKQTHSNVNILRTYYKQINNTRIERPDFAPEKQKETGTFEIFPVVLQIRNVLKFLHCTLHNIIRKTLCLLFMIITVRLYPNLGSACLMGHWFL